MTVNTTPNTHALVERDDLWMLVIGVFVLGILWGIDVLGIATLAHSHFVLRDLALVGCCTAGVIIVIVYFTILHWVLTR